MSDIGKLYEGLSDKTRAGLDKLREEDIKHVGYAGTSSMTYFCFGYLIALGATPDEANKACIIAQKKHFWQK